VRSDRHGGKEPAVKTGAGCSFLKSDFAEHRVLKGAFVRVVFHLKSPYRYFDCREIKLHRIQSQPSMLSAE